MASFQRTGLRRGLTFSGRRPQSANLFESTFQFGVNQKRSDKGKLVKAGKLKGTSKQKKANIITWSELYETRTGNVHLARQRAKASPRTLLKQYDIRYGGADFNQAFQVDHSPNHRYKPTPSPSQANTFPTRTVERKTAHANHPSLGVRSLQPAKAKKESKNRRAEIHVLGFTITDPEDDDNLSEGDDGRSLLRISQCSPQRKPGGSASKTNRSKKPIKHTKKSEPRISDLIKSKKGKTSIQNKCTSLKDQPRRAAWIRKHKHNNRTTKPGVWSKDMHKFYSDLWDPEADPEALNKRGFGIGQWRLEDHFKNRHGYARQKKLTEEEILARANSVMRTRSHRSDAGARSKPAFKLVVGVPSAQSLDGT